MAASYGPKDPLSTPPTVHRISLLGSSQSKPHPCVIDEEDASFYYSTDEAATLAHIHRYRAPVEWSQKRSSLAPSFSSAKTSIFRYTNSIVSSRTTVTAGQNAIGYHAKIESAPVRGRPWEREAKAEQQPPVLGRRAPKSVDVTQSRRPKAVPREVYACILRNLEVLHFGSGAQSCTTCYLRDLYNLALTSRAWDKAARRQLYSTLWLPPPTTSAPKQTTSKTPSRLKLLRKTLREKSALAKLVVEIKAFELQQAVLRANYNDGQAITNDLASLVMACPNLKRFVGFHRPFNHEFDRLNHALSTRCCLTERAWIIGRPLGYGPGRPTQQQAFDLYPGAIELFLHQHDVTVNLETLLLHGQDSGAMDFRGFIATFRKLPRLRRLHLSNFSAADFNDRTLAALPATLTALRLEALDGVSDAGLLRFAGSPAAAGLESLALVHQEIVDIFIVITFLRVCTALASFAIVQDGSPGVTGPTPVPLFRPVFASRTLRRLHWDILMPGPATDELVASLRAGAFPSLERLRAPCDYDGAIQDLCRPRGRVVLPADGYCSVECGDSEKQVGSGSASSTLSSSSLHHEYTRSLAKARRRAQERIDARMGCCSPPRRTLALSRPVLDGSGACSFACSCSCSSSSPFPSSPLSSSSSVYSSDTAGTGPSPSGNGIHIVVEEDGVVHERLSFDHVGTLGSLIDYVLEPDVEGSLDAVIGVADLMLGAPARSAGGLRIKETCRGPGSSQRMLSGAGRWHSPRERVKVIELDDFF